MKFTSSEFDLSQLVISSEQLQSRTPGLHVSSVIKHIKEQLGLQRGNFDEDDLGQFATIGRLWERTLADSYFPEPRYVRPGECVRDNIWGSPDCVDMEEWQLAEFKVCFSSYVNFEESKKWWEYMLQIKSYCYILGMLRAKLVVLFMHGDWKSDIVPRAREWSLLFTQRELDENWTVMVNNAKSME